ncbi:MAG: RHS repeat domain-containing protein [Planctomycetaceae bacterium]
MRRPHETVVYTYDAFGRRVAAVRHDGTAEGTVTRTETWGYDAQGQLTAAYSPEGTLLYTYDNLGRLTGTFSGSLATINAYDTLGRVKTVTDQSCRAGSACLPTCVNRALQNHLRFLETWEPGIARSPSFADGPPRSPTDESSTLPSRRGSGPACA